jgi:hypothetical protein
VFRGRPSCRAVLGGAFFALAAMVPAGAAEENPAEAPAPYPHIVKWRHAQTYVSRAKLVILAKVIDAGKPAGQGWTPNDAAFKVNDDWSWLDIQQTVKVEVKEVLLGKPEAKELSVNLGRVRAATTELYGLGGGKRQAADFALGKDATYLLFLEEPRKSDASGLAAAHVEKAAPAMDPAKELLDSVRGFCRQCAAWQDPGKLSADEEAQARKLIAGLGSADAKERDRAEAALGTLGARARSLLEEAARDPEPKRSTRAGDLLTLLKPEPAVTEFPGKAPEKSLGIYAESRWEDGQERAAASRLIVVARVVEAGVVAGKGADPDYQRGQRESMSVDVRQDCVVEISAVLRGTLAGPELAVKLETVKLTAQVCASRGPLLAKTIGAPPNPSGNPAALQRGVTYIFFLGEPGKDGGRAAASVVPEAPPMAEPDAGLLDSVRRFARECEHWARPPALPPEEDAKVKALVADLGAEDFEKRERAEAELKGIGTRIRPYLEAAAKGQDQERAFRAGELLKSVEPIPGKTELPGGAAGAAKPGAREEPPKRKPGPEPKANAELRP